MVKFFKRYERRRSGEEKGMTSPRRQLERKAWRLGNWLHEAGILGHQKAHPTLSFINK